MNYAGLKLGTWYPQGGFYKIIEGMWKVAEKQGVKAHLNAAVEEIVVEGKLAKGLKVNGEVLQFDGIVAAADYNHVEQKLLPASHRNYSAAYWRKRSLHL